MLGEDHALTNEFPELKDQIASLIENDKKFSADSTRYHELDKEIRELELDSSPIADETMHKLKVERSSLKDSLYDRIKNVSA